MWFGYCRGISIITFKFRYYCIESASIVICGHPSSSIALENKLEKDEKARIAAQVERLASGPEGLKKAEVELEVAKAENRKVVPIEIITVSYARRKDFSWLSVESVQDPGIGRKPIYPASSLHRLRWEVASLLCGI